MAICRVAASALRQERIMNAAIIAAPSSTKNSKSKRDPEMHQTRKGNQRHFGAMVHLFGWMAESRATSGCRKPHACTPSQNHA